MNIITVAGVICLYLAEMAAVAIGAILLFGGLYMIAVWISERKKK